MTGRFESSHPAGVAEWLVHSLHMREVRGSSPSLVRVDPEDYYTQVTSSAGDGVSTLDLKPMNRVNQSPKQRVPVAPQNGDLSPQKI